MRWGVMHLPFPPLDVWFSTSLHDTTRLLVFFLCCFFVVFCCFFPPLVKPTGVFLYLPHCINPHLIVVRWSSCQVLFLSFFLFLCGATWFPSFLQPCQSTVYTCNILSEVDTFLILFIAAPHLDMHMIARFLSFPAEFCSCKAKDTLQFGSGSIYHLFSSISSCSKVVNTWGCCNQPPINPQMHDSREFCRFCFHGSLAYMGPSGGVQLVSQKLCGGITTESLRMY